jgi:hypothetical protein
MGHMLDALEKARTSATTAGWCSETGGNLRDRPRTRHFAGAPVIGTGHGIGFKVTASLRDGV